jgi:hypothetical protein
VCRPVSTEEELADLIYNFKPYFTARDVRNPPTT